MPDLDLNKALDRAKKQEMDFMLAVNTSGEPIELLVQNRIEKSRVIKEKREMMETYGKTTLFLTGKCIVEDRNLRFELSDGLKPIEWKDETLVRNLIKSESGFPAKNTTFGFYKQFEWESESQKFIREGLHQKDEHARSFFEEANKLALENNYKGALRKLAEIAERLNLKAKKQEKTVEEAFFDTLDAIKHVVTSTIKETAENDEALSKALEKAKLQAKEAIDFANDGKFTEANERIKQVEDFLKSIIGEKAFEDSRPSASSSMASDDAHYDRPDGYVFAPELSDEFIGGPLDTSKWYDHNPSSAGRKPGYFSPGNVSIMDGKLYLCTRSEDLKDAPEGYHSFSTAAIQSKTAVQYGIFEVKAQVLNANAFSTFILYNQELDKRTNIDIYRIAGGSKKWEDTVFTIVHKPSASEKKENQKIIEQYKLPFLPRNDYHLYRLEWDESEIKWLVDGKQIRTLENTDWHEPLYIGFSVETFPELLDLPDKSKLPAAYRIEYIRSWKKVTEHQTSNVETVVETTNPLE